MDWLLISSLNAGLSVISVAILLISMRKMARSLRDSAALDQKLDKATQGLDQGLDRAISALRQEHQHLCVESKKIETKIKQAALIRAQIDRSLAHLLQTRRQMKKEIINRSASMSPASVHHAPKQDQAAPRSSKLKTPLAPPVKINGRNLPVFVMRKLNKAARPDIH